MPTFKESAQLAIELAVARMHHRLPSEIVDPRELVDLMVDHVRQDGFRSGQVSLYYVDWTVAEAQARLGDCTENEPWHRCITIEGGGDDAKGLASYDIPDSWQLALPNRWWDHPAYENVQVFDQYDVAEAKLCYVTQTERDRALSIVG